FEHRGHYQGHHRAVRQDGSRHGARQARGSQAGGDALGHAGEASGSSPQAPRGEAVGAACDADSLLLVLALAISTNTFAQEQAEPSNTFNGPGVLPHIPAPPKVTTPPKLSKLKPV